MDKEFSVLKEVAQKLAGDTVLTIDSFDKGTPIDLGGLESSIWYQK